MKVIRQGDVLLVAVTKLPTDVKDVTPEEGRVVLAHGEVTGHAHAVYERGTVDAPTVKMYQAEFERFLQVSLPVALKHEEHTAPTLPPMIYKLPVQVQYTPEEIKRVQD